jgi:hypothetical protein
MQAVKRKLERFPLDFMFELSTAEWTALRSQSVISKPCRGVRRYAPYACTEQGVATLAGLRPHARFAPLDLLIVGAEPIVDFDIVKSNSLLAEYGR